MKFRNDSGEVITPNSWIMRDLWDTKKGCIQHFVTVPKRLKATGVKCLVEDALWTQGLRTKLPEGKRRHEFQANHGFRKFFKTMCETAGVKPIVTETLMGHSTGISDSNKDNNNLEDDDQNVEEQKEFETFSTVTA